MELTCCVRSAEEKVEEKDVDTGSQTFAGLVAQAPGQINFVAFCTGRGTNI